MLSYVRNHRYLLQFIYSEIIRGKNQLRLEKVRQVTLGNVYRRKIVLGAMAQFWTSLDKKKRFFAIMSEL